MSIGHVALVVVDVQKDFCEGGALAVAGGNAVAEEIARYIEHSGSAYGKIVYTKDWHNPLPDTNGGHFDEWPVHCVQFTRGAELHDALPGEGIVFYKGQGAHGYSGFEGISADMQSLRNYLLDWSIDEVHIVGIAGDYCVRATALDAKRKGFLTYVLSSMVASVGGEEATFDTLLELALA